MFDEIVAGLTPAPEFKDFPVLIVRKSIRMHDIVWEVVGPSEKHDAIIHERMLEFYQILVDNFPINDWGTRRVANNETEDQIGMLYITSKEKYRARV